MDGRELARRETREGGVCALAVTVVGLLLGPLWFWLAPRTPMLTDGRAVYLKHPEGEEAIGADGSFLMLSLALGAVAGALVFLARRRGGVGLVTGMTVGGLLAAVVGWRFGVWLGPETDLVAAAQRAGKGSTFDGPLKLQAKGALLALPFGALLVHLLLTAVFGKRDPLPGVDGPHGVGGPHGFGAADEAGVSGKAGVPDGEQGPPAGWGAWPGPETGQEKGGAWGQPGTRPDTPPDGDGGPGAPER